MHLAPATRTGTWPPRWLATAGPRPVRRQRQLLRRAGQRLPPVRHLPRQQAVRVVLVARAAPAATARSPRTAPAAAPTPAPAPRSRAAYAADRSRTSGPIDQPSPAMWCTTSTSTCSSGAQPRTAAPGSAPPRARSNAYRARLRPPLVQLRRRDLDHRQLPARLASGQDLLVRLAVRRGNTVRSASCRADHIPQRRPQRRHVHLAGQPHRHRRCCTSRSGPPAGPGTTAAAARTTTAPHPAAAPPAPAPAAPHRASASRRQPRHGRRLEHAPATAAPTPSTARIRLTSRIASSECPPRSKKSSSTPTRSTPSTSANTPHRSSSRTRRRPPARPGAGVLRGGQRLPVQLPVHRQRQRLQHHHRGRAPCTPAAAGRELPQPRPCRPRRPPRPAPHRRPAACHPGASSRATTAACATCAWPRQHRLDLTRLDPEPADLHLIIGPAHELQPPVRRPPHQVPRAVHPLAAGRERVGHEPLRRQPRPAQIPPRQTRTRHIQLTRHTRRHRPQPLIQHKHPGVADRAPDRHHPTIRSGAHSHAVATTVASVGPYRLTSRTPSTAWNRVHATPATAPHRRTNTTRRLVQSACAGSLQEGRQHRRHELRDRDPLAPDQLRQILRITMPVRPGHHQRAHPCTSGHEELPHRPVEDDGDFCNTRSASVSRIPRPASTPAGSPHRECGTTTPFGRPVEPEVIDHIRRMRRHATDAPGPHPRPGHPPDATSSAWTPGSSTTTHAEARPGTADRVAQHHAPGGRRPG